MGTTHQKLVIEMFLVSFSLYIVLLLFLQLLRLLYPPYSTGFSFQHYWSLYCLVFLLAWWIDYYGSRKFKIWSLRLFLDHHSRFREETLKYNLGGEQAKRLEEAIWNKASSTITMQGIFIAIVGLFLTLVMRHEDRDEYREFLQPFVLFMALTMVIIMVFAIDLLDTVRNSFKIGAKTSFGYQIYFYRNLGVLPKGGISYAYYGYSLFSLFFISALSFFYPLLACLGLSLFTCLGYPILFGYKGERENEKVQQVEIDEKTKWPSITLGLFFLILIGLIWILEAVCKI